MTFRTLLENRVFAIYVEYIKVMETHAYDKYVKKVHHTKSDNFESAKTDIIKRITRETKNTRKAVEQYLQFEEVPF